MAKGVSNSTPEDKPSRTSFNVRPSVMEKVRYIGFMDKKDLSELVTEGLQNVIDKYEKKNGPIPVK